MKSQPFAPRKSFAALYPRGNAQAVDLLEKMMVFDPSKRISVEDALKHPYLASLSNPDDEPVCTRNFAFEHEARDLSKQMLQELIWLEMCAYHPEANNDIEARRKQGNLAISALEN